MLKLHMNIIQDKEWCLYAVSKNQKGVGKICLVIALQGIITVINLSLITVIFDHTLSNTFIVSLLISAMSVILQD